MTTAPAVSGSTAPRRAPAPKAPPSPRRPPLRPLAPGEGRRVRPGLLPLLSIAVVFAVLFALAFTQTIVIRDRLALDGLQQDVVVEQRIATQLEADITHLDNPARVIEAARALGMVEPGTVVYLDAPATAGS